jgi:hypothetical protein
VHEVEGRSMKEITEAMGISGRGRKGADLPRPTKIQYGLDQYFVKKAKRRK